MTSLREWNSLPEAEALPPILACCGSRAFADAVVRSRPFQDAETLFATADGIWWSLTPADWFEAFACHPRIGERPSHTNGQFSAWSAQEQSIAGAAPDPVHASIAEKNQLYEARHGFIYIVCASGRSGEELLAILDRRIGNSTEAEIQEAAEQQRQIMNIRLRKWLTQ